MLGTKAGWDAYVRVSRQAWRDLQWWTALPERHNGRPIWQKATTVELYSDASSFAWGATLAGRLDAGGMWSAAVRPEHITLKEMRAAYLAVLTYLPALRGQHVRFREDNTGVVFIVRNRSSRSPALMQLVRRFFGLLDLHNITLDMEYCPSALNLADAPSRIVDRVDWQLDPAVFAYVDALWGPHTHDRFASATTTLLPAFTAPRPQPGATAVDAWAQEWESEVNWINPGWQGGLKPMATLARLAGFLTAHPDVQGTVVAPYWPHRAEFQALRAQSSDVLVLEGDPALYRAAAPEVFVPTCHALAFFRLLPGREHAMQPTVHAPVVSVQHLREVCNSVY